MMCRKVVGLVVDVLLVLRATGWLCVCACVVRCEEDARVQATEAGVSTGVSLERDPDVLDTWFRWGTREEKKRSREGEREREK